VLNFTDEDGDEDGDERKQWYDMESNRMNEFKEQTQVVEGNLH
jgi:hypothetical protein